MDQRFTVTTTDGGTDASAWDHTNALPTLYVNSDMTNISAWANIGISAAGTNYFTWRVTNGVYSAWAEPSAFWTTEREWVGRVDRRWGTAGNWQGDNVPDAVDEDRLFAGTGPGEVDLDGSSYSHGRLSFDGGDYHIVDTNAGAGSLTVDTLRNTAGANNVEVGLSVTGEVDLAGGTLVLSKTEAFSANVFKLSGGALSVAATAGAAPGPMVWDFETGDLSGWNDVGTVHGPDNLFSIAGNEPVSHTRYGGKHGTYWIDCYDTELAGGSDGNTGILETDTFILGPNCQFTLLVGGGNFAWSGDPDAPVANIVGVALEREVAPGDWENVFWETGGSNAFIERNWNASAYAGDTARIRIYDTHTGGWGHTQADYIRATAILGVGAVNVSSVPLLLLCDSAIDAVSGTNIAAPGSLSVTNNAVLTTSGSPLDFVNTLIAPAVTSITFHAMGETYLGDLIKQIAP